MQKIELSKDQKRKLNQLLNRHSTYEKFSASRHDAYAYTTTLSVRVCPYCNINFTYTVYEKRNSLGPGGAHEPVVRPDLDHFEAKSKNRKLSKALENLIPCCQQCNSRVKGRTKFTKKTHIHPFLDDFDSIKKFSVDLRTPDVLDLNSFEIVFKDKAASSADRKRADRSIKDLSLLFRYQYHREEVVDLFRRARFYHKQKILEIEGLTETADLRRHLFFDVTSPINSVPLSKLKKDVLELVLPT